MNGIFNQDLRFGHAKPKNKSLKSIFRVKPKYKDRSKTCFPQHWTKRKKKKHSFILNVQSWMQWWYSIWKQNKVKGWHPWMGDFHLFYMPHSWQMFIINITFEEKVEHLPSFVIKTQNLKSSKIKPLFLSEEILRDPFESEVNNNKKRGRNWLSSLTQPPSGWSSLTVK